MISNEVVNSLSQAALITGKAIVSAIGALSLEERSLRAPSLLKPLEGSQPGSAAFPDVVGEQAAWVELLNLSCRIRTQIRVIVDLKTYHNIQGPEIIPGLHIWCYLDAVDGTIKLSGLGNQPNRLRAANDGVWGVGIAFTRPTTLELDQLCISDFKVAAIIDGSDQLACNVRTSPCMALATAVPHQPSSSNSVSTEASYTTFESASPDSRRLYTSTNTVLSQSFVYLDAFQAFDRKTHVPGDEELAGALFFQLMDRNGDGAFDVLRMYGNLAALLKTMLGWQGAGTAHHAATSVGLASLEGPAGPEGAAVESQPAEEMWLEAQCCGFLVINENLSNLIPALPIVLGAGGIATDFEGKPLAQRKLTEGRCNVLYAANGQIHSALMKVIQNTKKAIDQVSSKHQVV